MTPLFDSLLFFDDAEPHRAALNMAIDEILLRCANDDSRAFRDSLESKNFAAQPILRVYRWSAPAVSIGYFEKCEPVKNAWPQRELVRRWTGGGVVLHGEDWAYSLLVPANCARGENFNFAKNEKANAAEMYRAIHAIIAHALLEREICVAEIADENRAKISQAYFENAVRHDVVQRDGKKIAGAAQRRSRFGLLHQGSIQNVNLPRTFGDDLAARLANRVERISEIDPAQLEAAAKLSSEKYASREWMTKF